MKKILFFLGIVLFSPEISQATDSQSFNKTELYQNNGGGRRNKSGKYKKKKGFMWGIFKGKNQCDCPKH